MSISRLLNRSNHSANRDKCIFKKWENNELSTNKAIKEFRKNNVIDEEEIIEPEEFVALAHSLGWGVAYEEV